MAFPTDPLIYGPRGEVRSDIVPPAVDLNQTHPVEDLICLLRHPRRTLRFFKPTQTFSAWLVFKVVAGFLFTSFLMTFAKGAGLWTVAFFSNILPRLEDRIPSFLYSQAGDQIKVLKAILLTLFLGVDHLFMAVGPLFRTVDVVLLSALTTLFLPILGADVRRVSFVSIFLGFCLMRWLGLFSLIPGVGPYVTSIFIPLLSVYVVHWTTGVSFLRSFIATYAFYYFILGLVPAVITVTVAIMAVLHRAALLQIFNSL